MSDEPRERSESEEQPFTGYGHPFASPRPALSSTSTPGVPLALPPKHNYPGSPANYWLLDEQLISNMQWVVTPLDSTVPVFKEPHCVVEGTVAKVINESDGDHHIWLELDNSKFQLACEITPQMLSQFTVPAAGDHIRIYGIFRYDLQHGWPEIHPVDFMEPM